MNNNWVLTMVAIALLTVGVSICKSESEEPDFDRESNTKCTASQCSGKSACTTIYEHVNFYGRFQCYTLGKDQCSNFQPWWRVPGARVSSVDTHGTCIRLHDQLGCTGQYIQIEADEEHRNFFPHLNFNDRAVSVSSCETPLAAGSFKGYQRCSQSDCGDKPGCVSIYQNINFGGRTQCYTIPDSGCASFDSWWHAGRVSSVDTHGTCVRLFENTNCAGPFLQVSPGTRYQENLNNVGFKDKAKSVGPCEAPAEDNLRCIAQDLFNPKIDIEMVSAATNEVLEMADEVVALAVSSDTTLELDAVYDTIKFILEVFNTEKLVEVLLDARTEPALAEIAADKMNAKVKTVTNRLKSILSTSQAPAFRRFELLVTLDSCKEVIRLFEDVDYPFSQHKVLSSTYIFAFSSIYFTVAKLSYAMIPETRTRTVQSMSELASLNQEYLTQVKERRQGMITLANVGSSGSDRYIAFDALVCREYGTQVAACNKYLSCTFIPNCERCLENIKRTLRENLDLFFNPVITRLSNFA